MNQRRVVVTGMGITSCIGNNKQDVAFALRHGKSGISHQPDYAELGFRSQIAGKPNIHLEDHIDRKALRFMGDAAAYTAYAMAEAIKDAGLSAEEVSNERTGVIAGSGGASASDIVEAADILRQRGVRKLGAFRVPKAMGSTCSANIANLHKIKGVSYTITSACATSTHCIGHGMELIQLGKQDRVFVGGGEQLHWSQTMQFDAMGALSSQYNSDPAKASRPYDANRDGFVIGAGGGMLVLEDYEVARARGAKIYAELVAYAATSDGYDMVSPSGDGAERCMREALRQANRKVDYINSHGTSTPAGDMVELAAIGRVFDPQTPVSSTKALTGHSLGATGVQEAIYCLLMLEEGFMAGSANIETLDNQGLDYNIVRQSQDFPLKTVLTNNFGFGGTNASLIFSRL